MTMLLVVREESVAGMPEELGFGFPNISSQDQPVLQMWRQGWQRQAIGWQRKMEITHGVELYLASPQQNAPGQVP
jgi:hypothetical protein